jgi:hypothetical protein
LFDIFISLIDQSSDNSLDNRQLSQDREVLDFAAGQSGEQRREEAATVLSGRFRLAVGARIRADFQTFLPPNRALGQGMNQNRRLSSGIQSEQDDRPPLKSQ